MAISDTTLSTWTNQGATENSRRAYRSIEIALKNERYGLESDKFDHSYDIHLQGSYANHTNIYGNSDVDVVVRITMPFEEDLSELDNDAQERFWNEYTDIDYEFSDFHRIVQSCLKNHYNFGNVEVGDKAIKVESGEDNILPIDADVVPCADYRYYEKFDKNGNEDYITGMYFETQTSGRPIVNFSKLHRENGSQKNKETNKRYKPTIRMFKKANENMIDMGIIGDDISTSYYIEGLLYNVPNKIIDQSDLSSRYVDTVEFLEDADVSRFPEQSEMYPLCDDSRPDRWDIDKATTTVDGFRTLWESY